MILIVARLQERRRYLQSMLQGAQRDDTGRPRPRVPRKEVDNRPPLPIVPGYTVLVIDTNILLASLSMLASLIESLRWTVIIPLPVIMELDGLSSNTATQLSTAAQSAMAYITSHLRTHSMSLKVQTSKGNYLTSLSVRTEQVDFVEGTSERNMDDLILKAAIWQDEHWVDRSAMLKAETPKPQEVAAAVRVVLLSLDRNREYQIPSFLLPPSPGSMLIPS